MKYFKSILTAFLALSFNLCAENLQPLHPSADRAPLNFDDAQIVVSSKTQSS